jgi:hypothetical protein
MALGKADITALERIVWNITGEVLGNYAVA